MLKIKQGQAAIALVCCVLGFMLAVQFRTTQDIKTTVPFQRIEDLSQRLLQTEKERDRLQEEVEKLRQSASKEVVEKQIKELEMGAGVAPLVGKGVLVTIDDSKKQSKVGENPNLYLIHDDDILKVINELWAAGAEAIAINEQRLIASSEIRCAGPTLSVNNMRYAPPYEIRAIGNPKNLEAALRMRGGVVETLQFWGIEIHIKKEEKMTIPGYQGTFRFEYGQNAEEEEK